MGKGWGGNSTGITGLNGVENGIEQYEHININFITDGIIWLDIWHKIPSIAMHTSTELYNINLGIVRR